MDHPSSVDSATTPPAPTVQTVQTGQTAGSSAAVPAVLPALDGLRGVAALVVLGTHVGFATGSYALPGLGPLLARFDLGVALFFVLSGFLLTRPWVRAATGGRPVGVRRYLTHRAVRILPAYWTALAFVLLTTARGAAPGAIAANITLTQAYTGDLLPGFTQTWSLVTEVAFYLVLPLVAPLVVGLPRRRGLVVLGLAGLGAWAWTAAAAADLTPGGSLAALWLPGHADWFAVGMALAILEPAVRVRAGRVPAALADLADRPSVVLVLVVAVTWLVSTPIAGPLTLTAPQPWQAVVKEAGYAAIGGLLVGLAAFGPPGCIPLRLLASRAGRALGRVSYAVFLWHLALLELIMAGLGIPLFSGSLPLIALLTIGATLLVAEASWRILERPALRRVGARV